MNNLQEEFKQYLEENYGLDKKEEIINKAKSESISINLDTYLKRGWNSCDIASRLKSLVISLMNDEISFTNYSEELSTNQYYEVLENHIKIFNLDEYAKQHIERMV